MRKAPASIVLTLLLACPAFAAQKLPRPLKVQMKAAGLPVLAQKSVTNGVNFRSVPSKDTPVGFDSLFNVAFGATTVRILHKGFDEGSLQLFMWPERGNKIEIPRLKESTSQYYPAFGPLDLKGFPPVTFHLYFPPKGPSFESWKTGVKTLYALSMECMEGEAEVDGKKTKIALLDRNINGSFSDLCTETERDGDWFLIDLDGNGSYDMANPGAEARGLTKCVCFSGFTWSVSVRGREIDLKPVTPQKIRVVLDGFAEGDVFRGWSCLTGVFDTKLDKAAGVEIDRDRFAPWSYEAVRGEWKIVGALRVLRVLDPPASGSKAIEAGPKFICTLARNPDPAGDRYVFKCVGRAGDTVTVFKAGKRVEPVFVARDANGAEVLRKTQGFG